MMLHIKLPCRKVLKACEFIAEDCSKDIARLNDRYRDETVRWHDNGSCIERLPIKPDLDRLSQKRGDMETMIDMCKHAVGCVYVSPELWKTIRRHYRYRK